MNLNEAPKLTANTRERTGSRYSQRLRTQGGLPAILYGHGQTPEPLTMPAKETLEHIHKGEKLFRLALNGAEQFVLLRDVQFDHLGTNIVHADFSRVDPNERVHVKLPVHLIGEAVGLKIAGAILIHPVMQLDVECMVSNIAEFIEVDISGLEAGGTIYASQITLPNASMKLLSDPQGVVAHIVVQVAVDTSAEASTVGGAGGAQPEVIREKKAEEKA